MPSDAETTNQTVIEKDSYGGHDMVVLEKYEAPMESDYVRAHDPFKAKDQEVAATMMKWLNRHYPGYPWATVSDTANGIVKFNIPILMGVTDWWVVNLRTHEVISAMAQGAGQILERYRLNRGRFQLGEFLDARGKHSKLVIPRRLIPT